MVYCIVIPAILDIPTLVKQEYTVTEGIVESWNYSDEERLEERSISIKDDTGQEKSVIVYSTGIHQGEHLVVEYLPHSKIWNSKGADKMKWFKHLYLEMISLQIAEVEVRKIYE